ncbi:MAG: MXAN_6577-like cysteine-rich protein [Desulfuromonadaceae bacterium]
MKTIITWTAAFVVLATLAFAGVPQTISYQGYLKNTTGTPVSSATNMTFSLYSTVSGVGLVWNSISPTNGNTVTVTPVNGVYSVELGASPQPALPPFDRQFWLGIQAGTDPELRPLQPLSSVPYALKAASVADNSITTASLSINCGDGQVLVKTLTGWQCGMVCSCPLDQQNCGGSCANLLTDRNHCGSCGTVCPAGQICSGAACSVSCQTGLSNCSNTCVNLAVDDANCGACGRVCASGQKCSGGGCFLSCQTGLTNCSNTCVNLSSDGANCGACGRVCAAGQICSGGACVVSCQIPLVNCSGQCREIRYDPANCGACGRACAQGFNCVSGACQ